MARVAAIATRTAGCNDIGRWQCVGVVIDGNSTTPTGSIIRSLRGTARSNDRPGSGKRSDIKQNTATTAGSTGIAIAAICQNVAVQGQHAGGKLYETTTVTTRVGTTIRSTATAAKLTRLLHTPVSCIHIPVCIAAQTTITATGVNRTTAGGCVANSHASTGGIAASPTAEIPLAAHVNLRSGVNVHRCSRYVQFEGCCCRGSIVC